MMFLSCLVVALVALPALSLLVSVPAHADVLSDFIAGTPAAFLVPYYTLAVGIASLIDATIPQPAAGSVWLLIRKPISFVALNFGHASNGKQPALMTFVVQLAAKALAVQSPQPTAPAPAPATLEAPSSQSSGGSFPIGGTLGAILAVVLFGLSLSACSLDVAEQVADAVVSAIPSLSSLPSDVATQCEQYNSVKAKAADVVDTLAPTAASTVSSLEAFGDSVCSVPAPTTDAGTAQWLADIAAGILVLI